MSATPSATQTEEPPVATKPAQPEVVRGTLRIAQRAPRPGLPAGYAGFGEAGRILPVRGMARPRQDLFVASLQESSTTRADRATKHFLISLLAHGLLLAVLIILPFWFTETIEVGEFTPVQLIAPPPPPPPPPALISGRARTVPKRIPAVQPRLMLPTFIPAKVAILNDRPPSENAGEIDAGVAGGEQGGVPGGVPGGVLGGIPGGQLGGTIGSFISGGMAAPPPPPPASVARTPLRVGGDVKEPRKIFAPQPNYPSLARQARVEGDVVIEAVIDASGNVVEAKVISGHALLLSAALEAVRQWKYEPTYLNGEAVPVRLRVTVTFQLSR